MKILLSTLHFGALRNFESVIRALAAAGHQVHLVADRLDTLGGVRTIEQIEAEYPGRLTHQLAPTQKGRSWYLFGQGVRGSLDYMRYLEPRYDQAPKLRGRAERYAPPPVRWLLRRPGVGRSLMLSLGHSIARHVERAVPVRPEVVALLERERPDVVLITPLLYFGSQQVDYVRAARALGIPTALGVGSWDHLTTKGLIHEVPDRVIVWNEAQRAEAKALHGIEPDRVEVTGAQAYDHWFSRRPTLDRAAFMARVGLPSDRPMLLYLCSSPFIAPQEVGFVRRWIEAIRASSDPVLRDVCLLVRPHPQNARQWQGIDLAEYPNVAIWPREGANPVDEYARADYFHSMYYSAGVVGVNTSAQIESSILGKPVFTVLDAEFKDTQDGTLHFQHLRTVSGGLLQVSIDLPSHVIELAGAVRSTGSDPRADAFVRAFVRPHGVDVAATPRFIAALERLAATSPSSIGTGAGARVLRAAIWPVAVAAQVWQEGRAAAGDENDGTPGTPMAGTAHIAGAAGRRLRRVAGRAAHGTLAQGHLVAKRAARAGSIAAKRWRLLVHRATKLGRLARAKATGRPLP